MEMGLDGGRIVRDVEVRGETDEQITIGMCQRTGRFGGGVTQYLRVCKFIITIFQVCHPMESAFNDNRLLEAYQTKSSQHKP